MAAFRRGKKGYKSIYVPRRSGGLVQRSCGTGDPATVRGMQRMVEDLRQRVPFPMTLEAIADQRKWRPPGAAVSRKFGLRDAYAFYVANQIPELELLLSAKNLTAYLDGWITWVRAGRDKEARTADVYWQQVTTLITPAQEFLAAELTKDRVKTWLASRDAASSGTLRKYFYALKSFVAYCVDAGVWQFDPLAGMKAPKKNRARRRWVREEIDRAIVAAASTKYRAFFAFIKATGCDVGSAMRAIKGDLQLGMGAVDIHGTKTDRRAVHQAEIEAWAIPILAAYAKPIVGDYTKLFQGVTRSGAIHHHERIIEQLQVSDYTLKDARHSVAIRMRHKGRSLEDVARQLGTSLQQVATVYANIGQEEADAKEAHA